MLRSSCFAKNLELLSPWMPSIAVHLPHAQTARNDMLQWSGVQEAEEWFISLRLEGVKVLYVFGVGNGLGFFPLKQWLEADRERYCVFLEHDLGVLHHLLHAEVCTALLQHSQVQLHYIEHDVENSIPLEWLADFFHSMPFAIVAFPGSEKQEPMLYRALRDALTKKSYRYQRLKSEHSAGGKLFYANYYANLSKLPEAFHGNQFFGKFNQIPAIICGAGPSLTKQLPLLSSLFDKALIFGAGSALNVLATQGVEPHFKVGIDPTEMHLNRYKDNRAWMAPLFYRGRIYHELLNVSHSPLLYINGAGGYSLPEWIEEQLGIAHEAIDEGYSVATFALELARQMGCDPIILVGMDLAFTQNQLYASGVLQQELRLENVNEGAGLEKPIIGRDLYGKPLLTLPRWVCEAEWFSNCIKSNPQQTFINATEGGLGIAGMRNCSLEEVQRRYLHRSWDLRGMIHSTLQQASLADISIEQIDDTINRIQKSLQSCLEISQELQAAWSEMEQRMVVSGTISDPSMSGEIALLEFELNEEFSYEHILKSLAEVHHHPQRRRQFRGWKEDEKSWESILAHIELKQSKYQSVEKVATDQLEMIQAMYKKKVEK